MPSIVDKIAETEAMAEQIRSDAQKKAKSITDEAKMRAETDIQETQSAVRKEIMLRRENARHTGERLAAEIAEMRKKESERNCDESRKHIEKAVKYIIERL